jgi:hypothetical protein
MKFKLELWIKKHRKQCASTAKELNFWWCASHEDLKHLES